MLLNEEVRFAEFDEEFFRLSGVWLSDPEISLLTDTPAISDIARETWFRQLPDRRDYLIFGVAFDSIPVGVCGLKNISNNLSGEYWGYIGEKKYWGLGIGSEMVEFILKIAEDLNLKKVYLSVISHNNRAINLYLKHGFRTLIENPASHRIKMEKPLSR
jgi:RimJ/RimL family protein N-acetyltransferase